MELFKEEGGSYVNRSQKEGKVYDYFKVYIFYKMRVYLRQTSGNFEVGKYETQGDVFILYCIQKNKYIIFGIKLFFISFMI